VAPSAPQSMTTSMLTTGSTVTNPTQGERGRPLTSVGGFHTTPCGRDCITLQQDPRPTCMMPMPSEGSL
jgi:hypothetical protein